jgi:transcriptional regulator with XRE-family HTH domain
MEQLHPIRERRKARKLTLEQLATEMDVTASHLSEIERGVNAPSLSLAGRLSRYLDVPMEQIEAFHTRVGAAA